MSVVHFDDAELEAMWGLIDPNDTDVARALYTLGCANRAAFMTSYRESVEAPRIEAPRIDVSTPPWSRNLNEWFENLLYNCVSNGGSDFAPAAAVGVIRAKLAAKAAA